MKATTIKGQIRETQREIGFVNRKIDDTRKLISNTQYETVVLQVDIRDISKEELCQKIMEGVQLLGDYEENVYFEVEQVESNALFEKRCNKYLEHLVELEEQKSRLMTQLIHLEKLKQEEMDKYKNPEYIAYLQFKKKFSNEETL